MELSPLAAVAAARQDQLLREAAAERLADAAQRAERASRLRITALEPCDAGQIAALFTRLSARSRYLRYLAPIRKLPPRSIRYLAAIDHDHHEALGAFDGRQLIGAAHYFRAADNPSAAEIALEVADGYQGIGVGTRLLHELVDVARSRGITRLVATAFRENAGVLALVRRLEWPVTTRPNGPHVEIGVSLAET